MSRTINAVRCSEYYYRNRDRIREKQRLKRLANPEINILNCRAYKEKHRDEINKKQREKIRANPEPNRARVREYRDNNLEKVRAGHRRYQREHRFTFRQAQDRRRARKRGIAGTHTLEQWVSKLDFYGWHCYYCNELLNEDTATKDHAIPISRGGTDWVANILPACLTCNCKKNNKTMAEYKLYKERREKAA